MCSNAFLLNKYLISVHCWRIFLAQLCLLMLNWLPLVSFLTILFTAKALTDMSEKSRFSWECFLVRELKIRRIMFAWFEESKVFIYMAALCDSCSMCSMAIIKLPWVIIYAKLCKDSLKNKKVCHIRTWFRSVNLYVNYMIYCPILRSITQNWGIRSHILV